MRPNLITRGGGLANVLGRITQMAVTVVSLPIIARSVGVTGFGEYVLAVAGYFIGNTITDFGLTQTLASTPMDNASEGRSRILYIRLRLMLVLPLTAAALAAYTCMGASGIKLAVLGAWWGALGAMGEEWVLIRHGRFGQIAVLQLLSRTTFLLILLPSLRMSPTAGAALTCLGVSGLLTLPITHKIASGLITDMAPARDGDMAQLTRRGLPALGTRVSATLVGQGSSSLYATHVASSQLGLFGASDKVTKAVQSLLDASILASMPRSRNRVGTAAFWPRARQASVIVFFAGAIVAILLILASGSVISLLFGDHFGEAETALRIQAVALPFAALSSYLSTNVFFVLEKVSTILRCTLGAGLVFVVGVLVSAALPNYLVLAVTALAYEVAFAFTMTSVAVREEHRVHEPEGAHG